jgi:hypothetical protein
MKPDGLLEQVEAARVDGEDGWDDSVEHFGRPRAMIEVRSVVLPAGVVQKGEKTDYGQIGTIRFSDVDTECFNP